MGESHNEAKRRLRRHLGVLRRAMAGDVATRLSALVCDRLLRLIPWSEISGLVSYSAIGREVDVTAASVAAVRHECERYLPRVDDQEIEFRSTAPGVVPGWRGIPEPVTHARRCPRDVPLAIVIPGVGFDPQGNRLGRGGGFYDRALPHYPLATCIGVAFEWQVVDHLVVDPWDIPMDFVVTEARVLSVPRTTHKENRA